MNRKGLIFPFYILGYASVQFQYLYLDENAINIYSNCHVTKIYKPDCLNKIFFYFQTTKWGNVEWYHDLDIEELHTRVAAAALFIYWSSESSSIIEKAAIEF